MIVRKLAEVAGKVILLPLKKMHCCYAANIFVDHDWMLVVMH